MSNPERLLARLRRTRGAPAKATLLTGQPDADALRRRLKERTRARAEERRQRRAVDLGFDGVAQRGPSLVELGREPVQVAAVELGERHALVLAEGHGRDGTHRRGSRCRARHAASSSRSNRNATADFVGRDAVLCCWRHEVVARLVGEHGTWGAAWVMPTSSGGGRRLRHAAGCSGIPGTPLTSKYRPHALASGLPGRQWPDGIRILTLTRLRDAKGMTQEQLAKQAQGPRGGPPQESFRAGAQAPGSRPAACR
jgi:hypothetical protein